MSFIKEISAYIIEQNRTSNDSVWVLFPNRRPADYLMKALSSSRTAMRAPQIYSIDDFVQSAIPLETADNFRLISMLYRTFQEYGMGKENYDLFYSWGEMLIRDFSVIDKHLVPVHDLFRVLLHEKELTQLFYYLDPEQIEAIRQFWESFHPERISEEQHSFLHLWQQLEGIYTRFHEKLEQKHLSYEGKMYRMLSEHPEKYLPTLLPPTSHIIIAGFNTLTPSETKLFSYLKKNYSCVFFWDVDTYYTERVEYEAGYYFRKYGSKFPSVIKPHAHLNQNGERIYLYDMNRSLSQLQRIGSLLAGMPIRINYTNQTTSIPVIQPHDSIAIILPEESKLQALLSSISPIIKNNSEDKLNITMGLQLRHSLIATLFELWCEIIRHSIHEEHGYKYGKQHLLNLLRHPFIRATADKLQDTIDEWEQNGLMYISTSELPTTWSSIQKLLQPEREGLAFLKQLDAYLKELISTLDAQESKYKSGDMQWEMLTSFYDSLMQLIYSAIEEQISFSRETAIRLITQIFRNSRIAFQSESTGRIQIMGLIESQCLDFDHVFITDCNEDILPPSASSQSYIPYNIRKAFGLPTPETHHRMYSYYFYRVLGRAKSVHLFYNTVSTDMQPGEPSRYIHQLSADIAAGVMYTFKENPEAQIESIQRIVVHKTDDILHRLHRYTIDEPQGPYITPSAINTYLDCRLRFYFRYIAGMYEETELSEDIDQASFGNLLHQIMQIVYEEAIKTNKSNHFTSSQIENLHKHIETAVSRSFHQVLTGKDNKDPFIFSGTQIIAMQILTDYASRMLQYDSKNAPFMLLKMEKKDVAIFEVNGMNIRIGGKIDRLDKIGNTLRVMDYKSGGSNKKNIFKDIEELFAIHAENRQGYVLQVMLYCFMTGILDRLNSQKGDAESSIMPALIFVRDIQQKNFDIRIMHAEGNEITPVNDCRKYFSQIEAGLRNCLEEIFNPEVPFDQTPHEQHCQYCVYARLCKRKSENGSY